MQMEEHAGGDSRDPPRGSTDFHCAIEHRKRGVDVACAGRLLKGVVSARAALDFRLVDCRRCRARRRRCTERAFGAGPTPSGGGVLARRSVLKPMRENGRYGGLGGVARRAAAKYATM
jgi:hypothetical protein